MATKNKYIFIAFIVCLLHTGKIKAQQDSICFSKSLKALFELNFDKAESEANKIISPKERAYLHHYRLFLSRMINNDTLIDYSSTFESISDELLNTSQPNSNSLAYLSEVHLQKGIIDFSTNNKWNAIFSISKAHSYWAKSQSLHPDSDQNLKLKGIFNLLMGNLPDTYAQLAGWFGYTGNTETGLKALKLYLKRCKNKPGYHQEALLYLGFTHLKFTADEKQVELFVQQEINSDQPALIQTVFIRCAFKIRKPSLCNEWLENSNDDRYPTLKYLQGKMATMQFNTHTPDIFNAFLQHPHRHPFRADAMRYLSWHYLLNGDTTNYLQHQKNITALKQFPTWEDKQARCESELQEIPNIFLLKSRLLFDRGDYLTAEKILLQNQQQIITNKKLQQEFYYRIGRCYHLLNNTNLAEENYQLCMNLAFDSKRYFGPYAAIYAAQINADKKSLAKANDYLLRAKKLNNGELQSSAQQKINQIKTQISQ